MRIPPVITRMFPANTEEGVSWRADYACKRTDYSVMSDT
ncbi:hypothetical protein HMPREF9003_2130 [Bifidobacterium dentium JCVIHMP022]|uniref:Uncharacterized protein n=1 Tax=Bifidobacterium dentium JCVIHMP022 TaxID=553191 RepID=A0AB72YYL1_9BIFI|nr:hypothetical protein HMPREF9003_2130 [Bifidobacterium dentium JCVIHMP022]